ncbi:MAG: AMP-binding protein [Pseudomonadota bacterium]|nr:AMP-binding protein [Pseudomonadota bacterium]
MNLGTVFHRHVLREPRAVAIVDGEIRKTYGEWYSEILSVAGGLKLKGLNPGDHFVVLLSNRFETATLYWACQILGVVFTPFNWRASAVEITYVLEDADAVAVAFEKRSGEAAGAAISELGGADIMTFDVDGGDFEALLASGSVCGPSSGGEDEVCLMLYTSGTTGRPKGVPRSHRAERLAASHCVSQLYYKRGESTLGVMPMFHTMGVRSILMCMILNSKFVCLATWEPEQAMRLIEVENIDTLFLVPTMFHDIVNNTARADYDLSSAKNIAYAGMTMTSALTALCNSELKPKHFLNFYGSSEIFCFAVCDHVADKPGCAGRAGIGQIIRIVEPDPDGGSGPDDVVSDGISGEIIAPMNGMEAFSGYWKRPDADAKSIREGWYFTGDLGYFDNEGELYVVGRVDDMVISGGENIYPEEVEDVLAKSPLVKQAAVVGMPDERMGSRIVAFIEPVSAECSADALDAWCLDSTLARFKRPRSYVFVRQIPRSAAGKLLRRFLREGDYETLPAYQSTL